MSKAKLSVSVLESTEDLSKAVLQALLPDVQKYFDKIYNTIDKNIPNILIESITAQPEYTALINGTLQYEFGIPDPAQRVGDILDTIRAGGFIKNKPVSIRGNTLVAGITLQMIRSDFEDLLSLGSASIETEKGTSLNWLQWLLLAGDSIIISDHMFILGPSQYSRTGMGIMRENKNAFWRVPPEYAGDINNNWITRAIDQASSSIDSELTSLLNI